MKKYTEYKSEICAMGVFMLFFVVNIYDMVVLDWGIFCHRKVN